MNIYAKIQSVKMKLLATNIKKSGYNKYAGYNYYELADFMPYIIKYCTEVGLFTAVTFDSVTARLIIRDVDKPEDYVDYASPIEELELKGCNKIQALGGIETYSRRYLYMSAFDLVENDMFDGVNGKKEKKTKDIEETLEGQDTSEGLIDQVKADALKLSIENAGLTHLQVQSVLNYFGYNKVDEIKVKDYMEIVARLKEMKGTKE